MIPVVREYPAAASIKEVFELGHVVESKMAWVVKVFNVDILGLNFTEKSITYDVTISPVAT